MTAVSITALKGYFNTGDTPTESNFADLIDSAKGLTQTYIVDAGGLGHYTTLSAALAAIGDAAVNKRYTIIVNGMIAEAASVTAKDYIDVVGLAGASVTVTRNASGHGFIFNNLVSTVWRGLILVRSGAPGALTDCVQVTGTCTSGVRFENCQIINNSTGTNYQQGIGVDGTAAPYLEHCLIRSDCPGHKGQAIYLPSGSGSPTFVGCTAIGAPATSSDYAVNVLTTGGKAIFRDCYLKGGSLTKGVYLNHAVGAAVLFDSCRIEAGDGATQCYGVYALTGTFGIAEFVNCDIQGGNGGTTGHAVVSDYGTQIYTGCHMRPGTLGGHAVHCRVQSGASFNSCVFDLPNVGAAQSAAVFCGGGAAATFNNCSTKIDTLNGQGTFTITATFIPSVTIPLQMFGMSLNVGVAGGAGATLSVGTTLAGTEIINAAPITSTGLKYPVLGAGALDILAANATLYVTIAAGGGAPSVIIDWTAYKSYADINAVWMQDSTKCKFNNCALISSGASDAVPMTADVVTANGVAFNNCFIKATPATAPKKAINAAAAYNPAPIYNCVLVGGTTNITAAAGAANGTNVEV